MQLRLTRSLLIATGSFLAIALAPEPAQAGCCMERETRDGNSPWVKINLDFEDCRRENERRDGDDVSEPRGYVRWSLKC